MRVWLLDNRTSTCDRNRFDFRAVQIPVNNSLVEKAENEILVTVTNNKQLVCNATAYYVPPGYTVNSDMINSITKKNLPCYIAINGKGQATIDRIREFAQGANFIFTYEDVQADEVAFLEQLAWLRDQPEPFAVLSKNIKRLMTAILIKPHAILYVGENIKLIDIQRIAGAIKKRPVSPQEIDDIDSREALCLCVNSALSAGMRLSREHLTITAAKTKGLSPELLNRIAGCYLRYSIEPGEPLTFGHLYKGLLNE